MKIFVGKNFRHLTKISSLFADELFTDKVPYRWKVRRGYVSSVKIFRRLKVSSNRKKFVTFNMTTLNLRSCWPWTCFNQSGLFLCRMDLKFSAHTCFMMRNLNLNSVSTENQHEILMKFGKCLQDEREKYTKYWKRFK